MSACYTKRNSDVKPLVAFPVTTRWPSRDILVGMKKMKMGQHYIRQWRVKRGVSLRKLASMIESKPDGEPLVTYASLSRIETGEQPFSEPVLNAISVALNVPRTMLLDMDPKKEGHVVELLNQMDSATREQWVRMMELAVKSSAA